jgi:hypothetical protein
MESLTDYLHDGVTGLTPGTTYTVGVSTVVALFAAVATVGWLLSLFFVAGITGLVKSEKVTNGSRAVPSGHVACPSLTHCLRTTVDREMALYIC